MTSLKSIVEQSVALKSSAAKSLGAKKARRWLWISLAALAALQLYFVREMLAALLLFSMVFAVIAAVALVFFILDVASRRTLAWAQPQTKAAASYARHAWTVAELGTVEVSRKVLHRWSAQRP